MSSTPTLMTAELQRLHSMVDLARRGQATLEAVIEAGLSVNFTTSSRASLLILAAVANPAAAAHPTGEDQAAENREHEPPG